MNRKIAAGLLIILFFLGLWLRLYGLSPLEDKSREILVHIDGEIREPGLYRVDESLRLGELVELAGGLTEEALPINLAEKLLDGEKIVIPKIPPTTGANGEDGPQQEAPGIHGLSRQQWLEIPGIGEVTASLIMDYLQANPGAGVDDLIKVNGIGEKKLQVIKEYLGN